MNTFGFKSIKEEAPRLDLSFFSINNITIFHVQKLLEKGAGMHREHYDFIKGCYACECERCLELLNKQVNWQKRHTEEREIEC